jgi:hypothetical protein
MRQRELTRLLKSLGQLTHSQRQKVVAELGVGERQAASVAIVEGSVRRIWAVRIAPVNTW